MYMYMYVFLVSPEQARREEERRKEELRTKLAIPGAPEVQEQEQESMSVLCTVCKPFNPLDKTCVLLVNKLSSDNMVLPRTSLHLYVHVYMQHRAFALYMRFTN